MGPHGFPASVRPSLFLGIERHPLRTDLLNFGMLLGMSDTSHLAEMARQVRAETLRILALADSAWLTWSPPGTSNHMLWHAGHALWVADVLCIEPITSRSELPIGWSEKFGSDCRPVNQTRDWPTRDDILRLLAAQLDRVLELLANLPPAGPGSLAADIIHGWHDEAKHQGEMFLLLKMCRAK